MLAIHLLNENKKHSWTQENTGNPQEQTNTLKRSDKRELKRRSIHLFLTPHDVLQELWENLHFKVPGMNREDLGRKTKDSLCFPVNYSEL